MILKILQLINLKIPNHKLINNKATNIKILNNKTLKTSITNHLLPNKINKCVKYNKDSKCPLTKPN